MLSCKELEMNGHFCYWCGKKMEEHYNHSERDSYYTCDCDKAKRYDVLIKERSKVEQQIKNLKQESSAIDTLYEWKINNLKRSMELDKNRL